MDSRIDNLNGILLRDVRWAVKTAGPSPFNNKRTEIFLLGCKRAMLGSPCNGCFNSSTWDNSKAEFSHDPVLMAQHINEYAPNKYITIGGGEPLDQLDNLIILCKKLKEYGFHIIVYTWRRVKYVSNIFRDIFPIYTLEDSYLEKDERLKLDKDKVDELLNTIDILIDGQFKEEEKLYDFEAEDGLLNSVGSGNQCIVDCNKRTSVPMKEIKNITLDKNNDLFIERKR